MKIITHVVQPGDQDASYERLDIAEAATRLETTPDAIRKRIRRGSLTAVKEDGRWYIVLPVSGTESSHDQDGTPPDNVQDTGQDASRTELVDALRDEILFLRRELEQRSEEIQRRDVIISQLAEQIRRLPAPEGEPGSSTTVAEAAPPPASDHASLELLKAQAEAMAELHKDLTAVRLQLAKVEGEMARAAKVAEAPVSTRADVDANQHVGPTLQTPWWAFWRR